MGKLINIWSFIRNESISLRSLRLLLSLAFWTRTAWFVVSDMNGRLAS